MKNETLRELALSVLIALPLIALLIALDRQPGWQWQLAGGLLVSLIVAGAQVAGGLAWAAEAQWPDEPDERSLIVQFIGLTAVLGWVMATMPLLFTAPGESPLPPGPDLAVRLSWSGLCLAGVVGVLRAPRVPERWRMAGRGALCLLLGLTGAWPLVDGVARWWLGAVILAGFAPMVLLGWRQRRAGR